MRADELRAIQERSSYRYRTTRLCLKPLTLRPCSTKASCSVSTARPSHVRGCSATEDTAYPLFRRLRLQALVAAPGVISGRRHLLELRFAGG